MFLYLLRHAEAVNAAATDSARQLTEKGIEQAKRAGQFCQARKIAPELILSSPYVRAEQTARLVAEAIGREVTIAAFLASGMTPENGIAGLQSYTKFNSVLIAGHEPDFSLLAAALLDLPSNEHLLVRKGSLILLELAHARRGEARLIFSLPVEMM